MMIRSAIRLGVRGELLRQTGRATPKRSFSSSSSARRNAHFTLENLKIGRHTRVIFQGFTGPSLLQSHIVLQTNSSRDRKTSNR